MSGSICSLHLFTPSKAKEHASSSSKIAEPVNIKIFAEKTIYNMSLNSRYLTNWHYHKQLFTALYYLKKNPDFSLFIQSFNALNSNFKKKLLKIVFNDPQKVKEAHLNIIQKCIEENKLKLIEINYILNILYNYPHVDTEILTSNAKRYFNFFPENIKKFIDLIFSKHHAFNIIAKNDEERVTYYFFIISSDKNLYSKIIEQNYLDLSFHEYFLSFLKENKKYMFKLEFLSAPFLQINTIKQNLFSYFLDNDINYLKKRCSSFAFTPDEKKKLLPDLIKKSNLAIALLIDYDDTINILKKNLIYQLQLNNINISSPTSLSIKLHKGLVVLDKSTFSAEARKYIIDQMLGSSMVDEAVLFSKSKTLEILKNDMHQWLTEIYQNNTDNALRKIDEKFSYFKEKLYYYYGLCKFKHSYRFRNKENKIVTVKSLLYFKKWLLNIINETLPILYLASPHLFKMHTILLSSPIYAGSIDKWLKFNLNYTVSAPSYPRNTKLLKFIYKKIDAIYTAIPQLTKIIDSKPITSNPKIEMLNDVITKLRLISEKEKLTPKMPIERQLELKIYSCLTSSNRFERKMGHIITILKKLTDKECNNKNTNYQSILKYFLRWNRLIEHEYSQLSLSIMKPEEALIISTTANSCMAVEPNLLNNKYLLSSLCDAKNKVICIKGKNSKIKARAIIRFLFNKKTYAPALFLESLYSKMPSWIYLKRIVKYAQIMQKQLNIPLYLSSLMNDSYQEFSDKPPSNNIELASLGKALFGFEYIDSMPIDKSYICNGEFTLSEKILTASI